MTETPETREALVRAFLDAFEAGGLWDGLEPEAYKVRWRTKWAGVFADAALPHLNPEPTVAVVHCHDMEARAEHFNEGYDEAMRQDIGGSEARAWLMGKVTPILAPLMPVPEAIADCIADALLSEADLPEPTLTASEVKELTATATAVALALGRREAGEEIAAECDRRASATAALADFGHNQIGVGFARGYSIAAEVARAIASRVPGGGSNGLTATPASRSTPEEFVPAESAFPDLPEGSNQ